MPVGPASTIFNATFSAKHHKLLKNIYFMCNLNSLNYTFANKCANNLLLIIIITANNNNFC